MPRPRRDNCVRCGANEWSSLRSGERTCRACRRERNRQRLKEDQAWLRAARSRAKNCGLAFDLTLEDVPLPAVCPVLGIPIARNRRGGVAAEGSPSIDRFDNTRGYTKDNVRVISKRANTLKNNATIAELRAVLAYMEAV